MDYIAGLPDSYKDSLDHLHSVFNGVNGLSVANQTQLLNPPASLRPAKPVRARGLESPSPAAEAKAGLEKRYDRCLAVVCQYRAQCVWQQCAGCVFLDAVMPGGGGVCHS